MEWELIVQITFCLFKLIIRLCGVNENVWLPFPFSLLFTDRLKLFLQMIAYL